MVNGKRVRRRRNTEQPRRKNNIKKNNNQNNKAKSVTPIAEKKESKKENAVKTVSKVKSTNNKKDSHQTRRANNYKKKNNNSYIKKKQNPKSTSTDHKNKEIVLEQKINKKENNIVNVEKEISIFDEKSSTIETLSRYGINKQVEDVELTNTAPFPIIGTVEEEIVIKHDSSEDELILDSTAPFPIIGKVEEEITINPSKEEIIEETSIEESPSKENDYIPRHNRDYSESKDVDITFKTNEMIQDSVDKLIETRELSLIEKTSSNLTPIIEEKTEQLFLHTGETKEISIIEPEEVEEPEESIIDEEIESTKELSQEIEEEQQNSIEETEEIDKTEEAEKTLAKNLNNVEEFEDVNEFNNLDNKLEFMTIEEAEEYNNLLDDDDEVVTPIIEENPTSEIQVPDPIEENLQKTQSLYIKDITEDLKTEFDTKNITEEITEILKKLSILDDAYDEIIKNHNIDFTQIDIDPLDGSKYKKELKKKKPIKNIKEEVIKDKKLKKEKKKDLNNEYTKDIKTNLIVKKATSNKKKKNSFFVLHPIIAALIVFILGISIFAYPMVSSYLAEKNQATVISNFKKVIDNQDDEYYKEELAKAEEYNESLAGDPVHDPFVPGSGYSLPANYLEVLNVNGVMGYISIPKIKVKLPIYHGSSAQTLEKGVGHMESTSLPIGGDQRHAVLTGHRGLPYAKMFTDLNLLDEGDYFYIYVLNLSLMYKVDQVKVVEPHELEDLVAEPGKDNVTLITCTPYGINTHRLLVRGIRTDYIPEEELKTKLSVKDVIKKNSYQVIGIVLGLIIIIIIYIIYSIIENKKEKENAKNK